MLNQARLRLYSHGSKAASAGFFRCYFSATATRCSHAAILIATATAAICPWVQYGSFRCHFSATATRCSHAANLVATATATALPLLPGIVCGVLHRHNEGITEAWCLNSPAAYQHPFITSGSSLNAYEPGATAVTDWLDIAFSADLLSTDDLGQDVGERAQK